MTSRRKPSAAISSSLHALRVTSSSWVVLAFVTSAVSLPQSAWFTRSGIMSSDVALRYSSLSRAEKS